MPDKKYIFVLGKDGRPQMPTTRQRHVQKLLDTGKARVAEHIPYTIQLTYENDPVLQPLVAAEDPGRTNIGTAVLDTKGNLVFSTLVETRNKEIRGLMKNRKEHRMASRRGERKARQRLAKSTGTMLKAGAVMRHLPQYGVDQFITCKTIRNTEARFCNRKRKPGWLTPTVEQLVRTHLNVIRKLKKFLPITDVAMEVNRFAFMQMENPETTGVDFQNGPLKGINDPKKGVGILQDRKCILCRKKKIEHYHHIVPRYKGGADTMQNLAGLCSACHDRVHKDQKACDRMVVRKEGQLKKYAALSALNQACPYICMRLLEEFGPEHAYFCTGWETSVVRDSLGYVKTKEQQIHEADAYCIGALALDVVPDRLPEFTDLHHIRQFRRQDRARINKQTERRYYLDGKLVATNRRKRTEQKTDSLEDWYKETVRQVGEKKAHDLLSSLHVEKSTRYYNRPGRMMPGTVFLYNGDRYVMQNQITNGQYFRAVGCGTRNFPVKKCKIIQQNAGLVFLD